MTTTIDAPATHLPRVRDKVEAAVVRFCRRRIGQVFRAEELLHYCRVLQPGVAPDSPSRILRDLRQRGVVEYALLSRRASEYTVLYVAPEGASVARSPNGPRVNECGHPERTHKAHGLCRTCYCARWNATEKGRTRDARYNANERGRAARARYRGSFAGVCSVLRFNHKRRRQRIAAHREAIQSAA